MVVFGHNLDVIKTAERDFTSTGFVAIELRRSKRHSEQPQ
jgi:hypothetical protein